MKIGVFLNFVGLGSNLLHLCYCHQIAKKYGPVTIITQCEKLKEALNDDPLINDIILFEKKNKTVFHIFYLILIFPKIWKDRIYEIMSSYFFQICLYHLLKDHHLRLL